MSRPAQASLTRLEEIAGAARVVTEPGALEALEVDGARPAAVVQPAETSQIADLLRFAAEEKLAVIPYGGGTKLGIGAPPERYDLALDLSRMSRVLAYDPDDLTLSVEPGIRVAELLRILGEKKQMVPLAAPFAEHATIGGIVAANSTSPLRHAYGGIRDFCLGMEFVTGDATIAKSGGRVVKNVTGYDLHKVLIGSRGTLAVITRINFRTFPMLPFQRTFVATFFEAGPALAFGRAIAQSVLSPRSVDILGPGAARVLSRAEDPVQFAEERWSAVVTAAGEPAVVDRHARDLGHMASTAQADEFKSFAGVEEASLIGRIREFPRLVLESLPDAMIFRINVLPTPMPRLLAGLKDLAAKSKLSLAPLIHVSGVVYAAIFAEEEGAVSPAVFPAVAAQVFQLCAGPEIGAQAMLEWAPAEVKRTAGGILGPPRRDLSLMKRVKDVFDPQRVLSPGRFGWGI
jgi:glycolate oxidase FAD binding subunit